MHACLLHGLSLSMVQEHAITSDDALVLEQLPGQTVAIVGAGRVAMEFATIFRGLGADVHVICRRKAPLPRQSPACVLAKPTPLHSQPLLEGLA